jgi:hypothetical protein
MRPERRAADCCAIRPESCREKHKRGIRLYGGHYDDNGGFDGYRYHVVTRWGIACHEMRREGV